MAVDVFSAKPCKMTKRALHDAGTTVSLPDGLDHWHGYRAEKLAAAVYLEREGRL
jgi:hypothetical protein